MRCLQDIRFFSELLAAVTTCWRSDKRDVGAQNLASEARNGEQLRLGRTDHGILQKFHQPLAAGTHARLHRTLHSLLQTQRRPSDICLQPGSLNQFHINNKVRAKWQLWALCNTHLPDVALWPIGLVVQKCQQRMQMRHLCARRRWSWCARHHPPALRTQRYSHLHVTSSRNLSCLKFSMP